MIPPFGWKGDVSAFPGNLRIEMKRETFLDASFTRGKAYEITLREQWKAPVDPDLEKHGNV